MTKRIWQAVTLVLLVISTFSVLKAELNDELLNYVQAGNYQKTKDVLDNGADVNVRGGGNSTPLIFASFYNKPEIVRLLISYGANKDLKGDNGKTAMNYAMEKNYSDIIAVLNDNTIPVKLVTVKPAIVPSNNIQSNPQKKIAQYVPIADFDKLVSTKLYYNIESNIKQIRIANGIYSIINSARPNSPQIEEIKRDPECYISDVSLVFKHYLTILPKRTVFRLILTDAQGRIKYNSVHSVVFTNFQSYQEFKSDKIELDSKYYVDCNSGSEINFGWKVEIINIEY